MPEKNKYPLGCILEPDDPRNFDYSKIMSFGQAILPDNFIIDDPYYFNQGDKDSCVGEGIAGAKSVQEEEAKSGRFLWSLAKKSQGYIGWGTTVQRAMKALIDIGIPKLTTIPDDVSLSRDEYMKICDNVGEDVYKEASEGKISSYWYIYPFNTEMLRQALFTERVPFVTTMMWHRSYNDPKDGYLSEPDVAVGGHLYRWIGWETIYGRRRWIYRNTWSKKWGDNGNFYVWEDEMVSKYKMGTYFIIVDIPKDKAYLLNKYQGQLIGNPGKPEYYFVSGKDIIHIKNENAFYLGREQKWWGDWGDRIDIPDPITKTKTLIID